MVELEIPLPDSVTFTALEELVEDCCAQAGLRQTMKTSLKSYPESLHWHFQRPGERGTLEVTMWPPRRRLWLTIQAGRAAPWTTAASEELSQAFIEQLRKDHVLYQTERN